MKSYSQERSERILQLFDNDDTIAVPVKRFKSISRGDSIALQEGVNGVIDHMICIYGNVYAWMEISTNRYVKPGVKFAIHRGVPIEDLL